MSAEQFMRIHDNPEFAAMSRRVVEVTALTRSPGRRPAPFARGEASTLSWML